MFCPLKFNANTVDKDGETNTQANQCEGESCAWWLKERGCAIPELSIQMRIFADSFIVNEEEDLDEGDE